MKVIILAAGQGTRLRPYTDHVPKCMVKIKDKAILDWQLEVIEQTGIKDIIAVTGYKEEIISDKRLEKVYNPEYASTNMIYSLFCAEDRLEGDVIVSYGDIVYSKSVLESLIKNPNDIVIGCDEGWQEYWSMRFDDPLTDAETFKKGEGQKVKSLGHKPKSTDEIEGQYIGLMKFSKNGIDRLKQAYSDCLSDSKCHKNAWNSGRSIEMAYMTDLLNHFASLGELYYQPIYRDWIEVDDHDDLKIAEEVIHQIVF